MSTLSNLLLWTGALSFALLGGAALWSVARPARRIWPPPEGVRWKTLFTSVLTKTGQASLYLAGPASLETLSLPTWVRVSFGGSLFVVGGFVALWGVRTLGWHATQGSRDAFVASGPYRFTRNPQYVGAIAVAWGYGVACASLPVLVIAGVATTWFLLLPLAEEPWLREQYGDAFDRYAAQVRRYL